MDRHDLPGATAEAVEHNDDIFGATVNLASRICAAADAGHILVSDMVRDLGAERGFVFRDLGERTLKGYAEPAQVFELERTSG
jgi:adenylate cyclase